MISIIDAGRGGRGGGGGGGGSDKITCDDVLLSQQCKSHTFPVEKVKVHCSRTEKTQKPRRLREDKLTILTKNLWCAARRYSLFFRVLLL